MSEESKKKEPGKAGNPKVLFLLLAAAVVLIMMLVQHAKGGTDSSQACNVVPQSPWGQSQSQVWTDVKTVPEGKAVAGFDFSYPKGTADYPNGELRVYTRQAFEAIFTNDAGKEGMRIDKAYVCGKDVYASLYDDKTAYENQMTVKKNGVTYKENGNGGKISIIQWNEGDYSYGIAFWNDPVSKEEAEKLAAQVK